MEERQNERLRSQADITSLQLQLDRCKTELAHYSTESTRLAQQLKIRNQVDQEQYRRCPEDQVGVVGVGLVSGLGTKVDKHACSEFMLPWL